LICASLAVANVAQMHDPVAVLDNFFDLPDPLTVHSYIPGYSPECNPMEQLWNDWRDNVTHNHDRSKIGELEGDSDCYFESCASDPNSVLHTLSSPFQHRRQNRKN
jgi:hypothetical protein